MKKYTFKIDINNASSYDRLIKKLPTAYYRLVRNVGEEGYTLHSHNKPASISKLDQLTLQWNDLNNKMVLYYNDSALKANDNNDEFIITQEDFIDSTHTQEIITKLKSEPEIGKLVSLSNIPDSGSFGIAIPVNDDIYNTLNFINFHNKTDPVLQSITKRTDGLYFTIEDSSQNYSRNAYISDKSGNILRGYENSPYRFSLYPYYYRLHDLEIKEELEKKIQSLEEELKNVKTTPGPDGPPGTKGEKGELGNKGDSGSRGEKGNLGSVNQNLEKQEKSGSLTVNK